MAAFYCFSMEMEHQKNNDRKKIEVEIMKKKIVTLLCAVTMASVLFAGCGGSSAADSAAAASTAAASSVGTETTESTSEEVEETVEETAPVSESGDAEEEVTAVSEENTETAEATLADGVYTVDFNTDSSMFHINEALDGKAALTVENGEMTVHITLVSKNILNLYPGTADEAQEDGAVLLEPTTDEVTYSDGITEEVYGFDVPVPYLDEEFDLALIGTKGNWYDHKVSVSNPVQE